MKQLRLLITLSAFLISTFLHAEVVSGTCGKNLTWTFNTETGFLKIKGRGEMNDYGINQTPWYSYHDRILSLELLDGLTNIGRSAFSGCSELASVSIPNSVTNIGDDAFSGCNGLISISDGNLTNINTAKMRGVVVTTDNGFVSVNGLKGGEQVQFYGTDGKMLGSQKAVNGTASLSTPESVVICKMGATSLKVIVK